MRENYEYIYNTGIGYGGEEIYYDKLKKNFLIKEYVWHIDDGKEYFKEYEVEGYVVMKMLTEKIHICESLVKAQKRVAEITGNDYSSIIAKFEIIVDENKRAKYWDEVGPRSCVIKHDFHCSNVHSVTLYKINEYWLPDFKHEYSILKNHEEIIRIKEKSDNYLKSINEMRKLLIEKEKEKKSIKTEEKIKKYKRAGYITQYFLNKNEEGFFYKILLCSYKGIWLHICYTDGFYFEKYGIEYNDRVTYFDIRGETELRLKLNLVDSSIPLSTALIKHIKKNGCKYLKEIL